MGEGTDGKHGLFGSEFRYFGHEFVALFGWEDVVEPGGAFVEHAAYCALEGASGSAECFCHVCYVWKVRVV